LIERRHVFARQRDLRENRKRHLVFAHRELLDGVVAVGFFFPEIVTWKCQNYQPLVPVLHIQGLQPFILGGELAVAGDVDDQEHLAAIGGQRQRFAVDGKRNEIQNRCGV